MFKMSAVCSDTSTEALGPYAILYLLAGWGTSSPHTRDAGFHISVAVAAQQERVYREKIRTVEELQLHITEEWERLDQRIIHNAVKQWRKSVAANDGHFEHLLRMFCSFCC